MTAQAKHTATPWEAVVTKYACDVRVCNESEREEKMLFGDEQSETEHEVTAANFLHIIRCVNSHAALLAALEQTVASLEHWFPRHGDPEGVNSAMMQQARAAIAGAK